MDRQHAIRRFGLTVLVGICSALTVALAAYTLSKVPARTEASAYTRAGERAQEVGLPAEEPAAELLPSEPVVAAASTAEVVATMPETPAPLAVTAGAGDEDEDSAWPYLGGFGGGVKAVRTLNTEKQVLPQSKGGFGDATVSGSFKPEIKGQYVGGLADGHGSAQTKPEYKGQYLGGISDGFSGKQSPFIIKAQYVGGIADGNVGKQSPFILKAQYLGGIADGNDGKQSPFIMKAQYLGGIADGNDGKQSPFILIPQYLGGYNDGFVSKQSPFVLIPQYLGGISDGLASKQSPFILQPQYLGGLSDGFFAKTSKMYLMPQYLGGLNDGFVSKNSPIWLIPAYLGGIADGFLQAQPRPEFVPAFAGGVSDGFVKQTVPCDTTTIHIYTDSLICPKDTLFLRTDSIPGGEFVWKGPGGWTSTETNPVRPNFNQSMVGQYEVKLVNTGCPGDEDGWPTAVKYIGAKTVESIYATIDTVLPGFDVCEGTPVTFKVNGYGWSDSLNTNPPHFEWRLNGNPLPGVADSSTVTIDSLYNGHKVSVAVYSGLECVSARPFVSNAITMKVELNKSVNVQVASDISTNMDSVSACEGLPIRFTQTSVNAGNNPVFIWYRNGDSVQTGGDYIGKDLVDGDEIYVDLYSSLRCIDYKPKTSNKIRVQVIDKPKIDITPDQYILPGECVEIGVTGGSDQATYTWTPLTYLTPMTDRNDTIKVCPRVHTRYKVVINEPWGCSVSDTSWVYVVTDPRLIKHAQSMTVCDSTTATFQITASGVNLQYQWQVDQHDGKGWQNLTNTFTGAFTPYDGVNTNTLRVGRNEHSVHPNLPIHKGMDGYSYRCRIVSIVPETKTNDTIYSNTPDYAYGDAKLIIEDICHLNPTISLMTPEPICSGDQVTLKMTTDYTLKAGATIDWFLNGVKKQSGTKATFTTVLRPDDEVQVFVNNGAKCPDRNPTPSDVFKPVVRRLPSIDMHNSEGKFTVRVNTDTVVSADAENQYDGNLSYRWTPADKLVTSGKTLVERTVRMTTPVWYHLYVTEDTYGCTGHDSVKVNVFGGPLTPDANQKFVVCENDTVTLKCDPYGGSGEYHYTFSASPADTTGILAAVPDSVNEIKIVPAVGRTIYTITVFDGVSTVKKTIDVTSNKRMLAEPKLSGALALCDGQQFSITAAKDAYTGNAPSYQWYVNGAPVAGAINAVYKPEKFAVDSGSTIFCQVTTSYECPVQKVVTTDTGMLEIWPMPAIVSLTEDTSICQNIPVRLKVMTYLADSIHWSPEAGLSNPTVTNPVATPSKTTTYTVTLFTEHGCSVSDKMTMTILPATSVEARYKDVYACNNAAASLAVVAKGVDLKFRWQKFNDATQGWDELPEGGRYSYAASGALDIAKVDTADNDTRYRVIATGYCDPIDTSSVITLHIIEDVRFEITADTSETCAGKSITFQAHTNIGSAVKMYEWRVNGRTYGYSNYYGYTYSRDTLNIVLNAGDKVQCFVHVNGMVSQCVKPNPYPSNVIAPTVHPNPNMTFTTVNPSLCGAADGSVAVNTTSGTAPFEYSYDGGKTFGANALLPDLKAGYYQVQVRDINACYSPVKAVTLADPKAPMAPSFTNGGLYCIGSEPEYILLNPVCKQAGAEFKWFKTPECTGDPDYVGDSLPVNGKAGYHIYYVYQEKDGCKSRTVRYFMFVSTPPVIEGIDSEDPSSCELADGSITILATGDTTLYYSIAVPPVYTASEDFFNLKNGQYPVAVRDEAGCEVFGDTVLLAAFNTPEAPRMISRDTIYCKSEVRQPLQAQPINEGRIYWYKDLVLKKSIGNGNTHALTNYPTGDYVFTAVELVDGCYSKPSNVKVKLLGDLDLGLHDTVACLGATVTLAPKNVPAGATFNWQPGDYGTQNLDVKVGNTSTYYTLTVTDPSYGKYCQTTVRVKVSGTSVPVRVDTTACDGEPVRLDVPGAILLTWKDGAANGPRDLTATVGLKQYYANASLDNGCTREYIFNVTGKKIDTIGVEIEPLFDTVYCSPLLKGEKYMLEAKLRNASVPLDLQWFKDGDAIPGATNRTLDISNLEPGTYEFAVSIKAKTVCTEPTEVLSEVYTQTVYERPKVNAGADQPKQAYQETTCIGCDATVEGGTPFTENGNLPYIYTWTGPNIPASVNRDKPLQFMTGRMESTAVYTLTATDAMGCSASDDIKVTVIGGPFKASLRSDKDTLCIGDTAHLEALVSGGSGNYAFAYDVIDRPASATAAETAHMRLHADDDSSRLDVSPLCVTTKDRPVRYRITVVNRTSGTPTAADTLRLTYDIWVHGLPKAGFVTADDTTLCAGDSALMSLNGYTGTRAYWQYTTNGTDWTTFSATRDFEAAAKAVLPGAPYGTHRYVRAQVANGVCDFVPTDSISVRTYDNLANVISATGQTLCPEEENVEVTGFRITEGGNGQFDYLWQEAASASGKFADCTGKNSDTAYVITGEIGKTRHFRRLVFSDGCTYTSNVQTVKVYENALIGAIIGENYVCFDSTSAYAVTNLKMDTYLWQATDDTLSGNWQELPALGGTYTSDPVKDTTHYRVIGQANGCRPDTTPVFTVYPTEPLEPRIYVSADTMAACIGSVFTFRVDSMFNGGSRPTVYWYVNGKAVSASANKVTYNKIYDTAVSKTEPVRIDTIVDQFLSADGLQFATTHLQPGDSVWAGLASSINCVTTHLALSDTLAPTVYIPEIKIVSPRKDSTFCFGTQVELVAADAVEYEWFNRLYGQRETDPNETRRPGSGAGIFYGDTISGSADSLAAMGYTDSVIYVSPLDSLHYFVYGTDRHGCFGYDSVLLAPEPMITKMPDTVICEGNEIRLYARPDVYANYTWSESKEDPDRASSFIRGNTGMNAYQPLCKPVDSMTVYYVDITTLNLQCHRRDSIIVYQEKITTPELTVDYSGHHNGDTLLITECDQRFYTLSAHVTEAGKTPEFKWLVNGEVWSRDTLLSDSGFQQNAYIHFEYTSSKQCVTRSSVRSQDFIAKVTYMPTAAVSINSNKGLTVCPYDTVTIYKTHSPSYDTAGRFEWFVRRAGQTAFSKVQGASDTAYIDRFAAGDEVYIVYYAYDSCIKNSPARSNILKFGNYKVTYPQVSISAITGDTVCEYTAFTLKGTAKDAGKAPEYQWYKDGIEIGQSFPSITYSAEASENGDFGVLEALHDSLPTAYTFTLRMTVHDECPIPGNVVEVDTTIYVLPNKTPFVLTKQHPDPLWCNSIIEEPIAWSNNYNLSLNGGNATLYGHRHWDAGATSKQLILDNGSISGVVGNTDSYLMIGLTSKTKHPEYADYHYVEFAAYACRGYLEVYEEGVYKGRFGTYKAGDRLSVEITDSVVYYLHNDRVYHVSANKATAYPYQGDVSLYHCSESYPTWYDVRMNYRSSDVYFSAEPHWQGDQPVYNWYINGQLDDNRGLNDTIFRSPYHLFEPGDEIQVRMTSSYRCLWQKEALSQPIVIPELEPVDFLSIMPDTSVCYGDSIRIAAYGAERYSWNPLYAPGDDTTYSYYWRYEYDTADWHYDSAWMAVSDLPAGTPYDTASVVNDSLWNYFYTGTLTVRDSVMDSLMSIREVLRAEWDSMPWVAPEITTWYKVTGWNGSGCATTKRIKVEVLPLPTPKTGPDYHICYGDSITLTALYGGKKEDSTHVYAWHTLEDSTLTYSGATVRIAPDSTHTYVVTETAPTGCFATDTITVAVYPYPTPYFEPKDTSVCRNREVIYSDTSAYDSTLVYTWTPSSRLTRLTANGSSVRFASADTGSFTYYVQARTPYGCARYDTLRVRVENHHVTAYIVDELNRTVSGDTLCKFDSAVYVVKGENWGENPTLEWFVDNVKQPVTGDTFVYVADADGRRAVRCLVTPGTGLCPDVAQLYTDVLTVTVFPIDSAGVDMVVDGGYTVENDTLHLCAYDTAVSFKSVYTLTAKDPGVAYRWMHNDDTVSLARNQRIGGLKTGDRIYVYATSGLLCARPAASADSMTVYVHDRATELDWNPDTDTVGVCSKSENVISVSGMRDYVWTPTTNLTCRSALCDTVAVRAPDASASRWIYLTCTDSYGCRVKDSIYVYGLNNAEPDTLEMCYGDTAVYDLSADYRHYDSVVWEPADYLSDPHSLSPAVMAPTDDLAYTLHLFHTQSGCGIELHPTVKVRPYLGISMTVTDTIPCAHDSIWLSVNPNGVAAARLQGAHYAYSVVPARSASQLQDLAQQWMWADSACTVYVTVTDRFGCRNTDSLSLFPIAYDTLQVTIDGFVDTAACVNPKVAGVNWKRVSGGLTATADGLSNGNMSNSWSPEAFGGDSIPARGELRYTVTGNEAGSMVGLSYKDHPNNTLYIDYAFYVTNYGGRPYRLYIYERGTYVADAGTYQVGDRLTVERNDGYVSYYRSGQLVYRSAEHGTGALYADVATYYAQNVLGRVEMLAVEQPYSLTSTVINGGDAPQYAWFVNGALRSTDSVLPPTVQLHSFDTIVLRVASSFKCPACPEAADTVVLDEIADFERLELTLSEQTHGCTGDSAYFTVHTVSAPAGAQLTYRWFRNGFLMAETTDSVQGFENVVRRTVPGRGLHHEPELYPQPP